MESNRLIRAALGVATLLAATYVFEPTLFGGTLSEGWAKTEMLRSIVGIVGAVFGLLMIFDAVFPKAPPRVAAAPAPAPAPLDESKPEESSYVAQEAAEAVWGSYIEPTPGAVETARGLVEAELAERAEAAAETAPPEEAEPSPGPPPKTREISETPESPKPPEINVGGGLPPPPPRPPKPE